MLSRAALWSPVCLATLALASCGGDKSDRETVMVSAASSLTDAFEAMETAFEANHKKIDVRLMFAGSQSIRTQIENGARTHVFASANDKHMAILFQAGLVGEPDEFARNELVIAVPADNPAKIVSLADLVNAKRLVLAADAVPAGAYAEAMLERAQASNDFGASFRERVMKTVVSRENHVRQTLQKVVLGEADAAIVYRTDATAAGDKVKVIEIPLRYNVIASYPIAQTKAAFKNAASLAFIEFVVSPQGQKFLAEHGFRPPGDDGAAADSNPIPSKSSGFSKMRRCPSATPGATTKVTRAQTTIEVRITANEGASFDKTVAEIRERASHLAARPSPGDADVKHDGTGTGGGSGKCPVIHRDGALVFTDVEGGALVSITPPDNTDLAALEKEIRVRLEALVAPHGSGLGKGNSSGDGTAAGPTAKARHGSKAGGGLGSGESDGQGQKRGKLRKQ